MDEYVRDIGIVQGEWPLVWSNEPNTKGDEAAANEDNPVEDIGEDDFPGDIVFDGTQGYRI